MIALRNPDGELLIPAANLPLEQSEAPQLLDGEPLFANVTLTITPIPFHTEGLHRIEIDLDGARVQEPSPRGAATTGPSASG